VDVVYPRENRRLWDEVVGGGGLVSEAPPGARPESWRFPLRNRIIAALSQVLVVVESSRQGGAMHTVLAADAYGVPVLAVPGSVRSPQSEGTNAIIQEGGAGVVLDVHDVLATLELECLADGTPVSFSPIRPADVRREPVSTSWQNASGRQPGRGKAASVRPGGATSAEVGSAQQAMDFISGSDARQRSKAAERQRVVARCTPTERAVLEGVDYTTTLLDVVCLRTNLDLGAVALAMDRLDELGLVRSAGGGWVRL
jgi:predicted Rossmann fold nucleotide-binding protein DprA/Smf involved in DNA uptake